VSAHAVSTVERVIVRKDPVDVGQGVNEIVQGLEDRRHLPSQARTRDSSMINVTRYIPEIDDNVMVYSLDVW
jgi:hypothetical protein